MIRKNLSSCCAAFVLLCGQSLAADADIKKSPNIIFILIDDMPYTSMSLTGNPELETPNMDRLAKQGMFFTRAYTENLCYPSRASFLTGQCAARHGRTDVIPGVHPYALMKEPLLPLQPGVDLSIHIDYIHSSLLPHPVQPETYTIVKALKGGGYRTALSGKWHLPKQHLTPAEARDHGFDFCNKTADRSNPYRDTEHFTDDAIRFMHANRDQNFFLYLPYVATHGPHIVPDTDKKRWMENLKGKDTGFSPDLLATLEFIDLSVGRLLATLDELGLTDNTMVVLTGDDGGHTREVYSEVNKPFRIGKGSLYEGGARVPLIVRWPGQIAPGIRCDVPVHIVDLFPTFCDVAGVDVDPGHILDGVSLKPLFSGSTIPERSIFLHYPHYHVKQGNTPVRAVIQSRYKLLWNPYDHIIIEGNNMAAKGALRYVAKPRIELFDLQTDPGERHNLAERFPEKVAEMCKLFETWMKETGARDVSPNPAYDANNWMFNARDEYLKSIAQ